MLGVGMTQTLSRFRSSPSIDIKGSEVMDLQCSDGSLLPSNASPNLKKRNGLLKGLKRLRTFFSANSSASACAAEVQPNSDPSQHAGLAHTRSTPDLPCAAPISMSASPSPSYMEMAQNSRVASLLHSGGAASPPMEVRLPCSPFPIAGRSFLRRDSGQQLNNSISCYMPSLRCNVVSCGTPAIAISSTKVREHVKHQQPSSSPVAVLSPDNSCSSVPGRLEVQDAALSLPAGTAATATALLSCDEPTPAIAAAAQTQQPAAVTPCLSQPSATLLALNPTVPGPMRRRVWCLEDYQVVKRLYKGSTASVYKATCMRSGQSVALKVYFLARVPRNVVHMIKREIELHHQLVHPNVIRLYAAFLDGDRIVLVQEYATRGDLFHLLRQMGGRMTEAQASDLVIRPFLEALAYLHSQGICHRDIKPENILFNEGWVLKIADFGVSINLNEERAVTRAGTVDYMAPEVTRCPLKAEPQDNKDDASLAYSSAVDIWAAGVLSYELLVGFTPMVAPPQCTAAAAKLSAHPHSAVSQFMSTAASSRSLHFPASLTQSSRDFIRAALSENPGDRPTAKELLRHPWICAC